MSISILEYNDLLPILVRDKDMVKIKKFMEKEGIEYETGSTYELFIKNETSNRTNDFIEENLDDDIVDKLSDEEIECIIHKSANSFLNSEYAYGQIANYLDNEIEKNINNLL